MTSQKQNAHPEEQETICRKQDFPEPRRAANENKFSEKQQP
jgi:hypothetical protein